MERLMPAKIGLVSLGLLAAAGLGAMLLGSREDQYCFGPPVHNWAWQLQCLCLLAVLASPFLAMAALRFEARKLFAVLTIALFVPVLLVDALTAGCN